MTSLTRTRTSVLAQMRSSVHILASCSGLIGPIEHANATGSHSDNIHGAFACDAKLDGVVVVLPVELG